MKRNIAIVLMALLAWCAASAADADSVLSRLTGNFDRFARMFPQERVYVHFDNTSYYKGEYIWYKAYVVRDDNLHHTNLSAVLYVELLNPIGYPVETQKLVIKDGQAHGSFLLKDTLNAGFYEVRAYTAWMLNFTTGDAHGWDRLRKGDSRRHYGDRFQRYLKGNAGVFSRVFPIYEKVDSGHYSQRRIPQQPKITSSALDPVKDRLKIDFYPEGGNLIQDVPTRIAFQAHNTEGRTLNVEGALMRRGDSIGYFRTDYAGRGCFSVTPDSLDTDELTEGLQLKMTYAGHNYRFSLPKPKKRGYSLSVFNSGQQLKTVVTRNRKTKGMQLGVSISSRGRTLLCNTVDLQTEEQTAFLVDSRSLQTGVNVVTLFSQDGQVLAQRLVFVNNHDMDGLRLHSVRAENDSLEPYAKVTLDYQLVDRAGQPVKAAHDFSVAVTDCDSREPSYDDNSILSYLLLSSEVKGFIPHPEYYFEADDNEHRQALDVLLMIQGWTRYDYEQMMSGRTFEPMLAVERGLTFAGRLWDDNDYESRRFWKLQNKKPAWVYAELYVTKDTAVVSRPFDDEDGTLYPSTIIDEDNTTRRQFLMGEARVDSAGCFRLNMVPFYGKGLMALVLNKQSIEELGIDKGGIAGHNFRWNTIRRPWFLLGKRIEPLNQYSPLPKNYNYYETAALNDPIDRDMFRYGFMTMPDKKSRNKIYYDAVTRTYMLPDVEKRKRRRWDSYRDSKPVCVMDVRDLMAWLSNIYGDISDFRFRDRKDKDYNADQVVHEMMMEDARWLDEQYGTDQYSREATWRINNEISHKEYELDAYPHFARLAELLYIFGLDGMNMVSVDAPGYNITYSVIEGNSTFMPVNIHSFPVNENFRELELYAETDNRRLTYQQGRYHEAVFTFDPNRPDLNGNPLTSIFNFKVDKTYPLAYHTPDFMGFRINFQGFSTPAEFYQPDYEWEPEPENTDYRRTVYWNPQVTTDSEGRAHIEFYNNGFSKKLAVSAEGITSNGQPINME